jgi:hypothetical protein
MADDAVLEILKSIQADVKSVQVKLDRVDHTTTVHGVGLNLLTREVRVLQQDTRELRTAINDMERTRFTKGEVEALHTDVTRLQQDHHDLAVKVGVLEERSS